MQELQQFVEEAWETPSLLQQSEYLEAVNSCISLLNEGKLRCAYPNEDQEWIVLEWVKKAILLYFRSRSVETTQLGPFEYCDKIPLKTGFTQQQIRVVPPATVRYGAYIAEKTVLMPSYVNIGAYVGEGTMIDTWATVGSCAQIGRNVHISGGVGIGGVLEPLQARPVIIEDDVFIGSRSVIVEGIHVQQGAVIAAGVTLTASTHIIDVTCPTPIEYRNLIPPNSVVIGGHRKKRFPAGEYYLPCALIIGKRKASTNRKTSLNKVLREYNLPT